MFEFAFNDFICAYEMVFIKSTLDQNVGRMNFLLAPDKNLTHLCRPTTFVQSLCLPTCHFEANAEGTESNSRYMKLLPALTCDCLELEEQ